VKLEERDRLACWLSNKSALDIRWFGHLAHRARKKVSTNLGSLDSLVVPGLIFLYHIFFLPDLLSLKSDSLNYSPRGWRPVKVLLQNLHKIAILRFERSYFDTLRHTSIHFNPYFDIILRIPQPVSAGRTAVRLSPPGFAKMKKNTSSPALRAALQCKPRDT
jgi:hypothetical protein